ARRVLDEAVRRGLCIWQQHGAAYVAKPLKRRLERAPGHWQRLVGALGYEIACLLDWGCTVERAPGTDCFVYRPACWHSEAHELVGFLVTAVQLNPGDERILLIPETN